MKNVRKIDIGEELAAIERGECGLCRIGLRHPDDSDCEFAEDWNAYWDRKVKEGSSPVFPLTNKEVDDE